MKRIVSMLICMILVVAMVGCGSNSTETTEPGNSANTDNAGPIDMEAFLKELVKANPTANTETLCRAMLENNYFKMFSLESTEYYYPGLDYEYVPTDIKEAYCIMDMMTGTGAVVYAIEPKDGVDAQKLGKEIEEKFDRQWMAWDDETKAPDQTLSTVIDGKLFVTMYRSDMQPVTGPIATKAHDFIDMFHEYAKNNSGVPSTDIANYLMSHQKLTQMFVSEVTEGQEYMEGLNSPVSGFSDGALLSAMMRPNAFIAYVFNLKNEPNIDKFETQLKQNANPAWNICMVVENTIIEKEGDYILFMMCND